MAATKLIALPEPPPAVLIENSFVSPSLIYPSFPGETKVPDAIAALEFVQIVPRLFEVEGEVYRQL